MSQFSKWNANKIIFPIVVGEIPEYFERGFILGSFLCFPKKYSTGHIAIQGFKNRTIMFSFPVSYRIEKELEFCLEVKRKFNSLSM